MPANELNPYSGYSANAGLLAIREGRFDEAGELFRAPLRNFPLLAASRSKAMSMALLQRVEYVRSRTSMSDKDLTLLGRLYNKGKNLGAQDPSSRPYGAR